MQQHLHEKLRKSIVKKINLVYYLLQIIALILNKTIYIKNTLQWTHKYIYFSRICKNRNKYKIPTKKPIKKVLLLAFLRVFNKSFSLK